MSDSILIGIHDLVSKVILIESNDHLNMTFKVIFDTNVQKKFFESKSTTFKTHILLGLVRNVEALLFTNVAVTYPITRLTFNGFQKLIPPSSELHQNYPFYK